MTPIEIACRHTNSVSGLNCGAQAGDACRWADTEALVYCPSFHSERVEDAAAMSGGGDVSAAAFDRAVENSGLV
jgi:hypothetical protein